MGHCTLIDNLSSLSKDLTSADIVSPEKLLTCLSVNLKGVFTLPSYLRGNLLIVYSSSLFMYDAWELCAPGGTKTQENKRIKVSKRQWMIGHWNSVVT